MYFDDDCQDTKVKLNNMTNYESAIRFNGAYFTTQGTATETWENTFDNALTTKKRLDGSFASGAGGIDWYYNSANSNMDVSNVTYNYNGIPSKITPVIGTNGITDCDALPLRIRETTNMSSESIEFILYPNPVSGDYIYIHNDLTEGDLSYKIYDCTGRQISSLNSYNQFLSIEVSQLKSGLYNLICYVNNEKRYTNRFIVQR